MTSDDRVRTPARRPGVTLLAALALAAIAPSAHASPMSTLTTPAATASIPLTQTDWSPGSPASLADPLSVPKFDPSLGALRSVNVAFNYTVQNDFSMTFVSPSTISVGATAAKIALYRPDHSVLLSASPADVSKSQTITGPPFPHDVTFPTITRNGSAGTLSLSTPADLALFTAAKKGDTIALPVSATSQSTFASTSGNGTGRVSTRAGVGLTVSYTYAPITPVPEPATLAVLGGGVLLALASRRRKAS